MATISGSKSKSAFEDRGNINLKDLNFFYSQMLKLKLLKDIDITMNGVKILRR